MDAVVSWNKTETVMTSVESGNATNEQPYAEFSDSKPPSTFFIGKFGIPRTELILGVCLAVAVVVCIILIPFAAQGGSSGSDGPDIDGLCFTPECLEAAGYVISSINTTAQPCDNFYQYACGLWEYSHPLNSNQKSRTVHTNIHDQNQEKILRVLESSLETNWTMEQKMRGIFASCMDEYSRQKTGGKTFIQDILDKVGGWYVLGTFDQNTYDINDYLKKVHVDFWTDVLFHFRIVTDLEDATKKVIEVRILYHICQSESCGMPPGHP